MGKEPLRGLWGQNLPQTFLWLGTTKTKTELNFPSKWKFLISRNPIFLCPEETNAPSNLPPWTLKSPYSRLENEQTWRNLPPFFALESQYPRPLPKTKSGLIAPKEPRFFKRNFPKCRKGKPPFVNQNPDYAAKNQYQGNHRFKLLSN